MPLYAVVRTRIAPGARTSTASGQCPNGSACHGEIRRLPGHAAQSGGQQGLQVHVGQHQTIAHGQRAAEPRQARRVRVGMQVDIAAQEQTGVAHQREIFALEPKREARRAAGDQRDAAVQRDGFAAELGRHRSHGDQAIR